MKNFLKTIGSKIKSMFSKINISKFCDSAEKFLSTKIGIDRLLHCFAGALAVAVVSPLNSYWVVCAAIIIVGAFYVKERFIDKKIDKFDFISVILGAAIATMIHFLMK
jgi:hypothetical protein